MKTMKGLSMNKMLGSIKRKPTQRSQNGSTEDATINPVVEGEGPEVTVNRCVKLFCESGGPNATGDEVTYLPPIVDAAESSPTAAAEAARLIRKYFHRDYWSKPSWQYNGIMLMRILCDNPGATFTRGVDKKFVEATKELLRGGRDPSVRQILMETLDALENQKFYDENLGPIIEMWKKEKEKAYKAYGGRPPPSMVAGPPPMMNQAPRLDQHTQNYFSRSHSTRQHLPNPVELANRLEEARTSAKLLEQVVACTPPSEILSNDLIKEFADRCHSASRSIQGYMASHDPAPDNDTMESLIDTNEQLQNALNGHGRAILNARKQMGLGERSQNTSPRDRAPDAAYESGPPRGTWPNASAGASSSRSNLASTPPHIDKRMPSPPSGKGKGTATWSSDPAPGGPPRSRTGTPPSLPPKDGYSHDGYGDDNEDPFRDPTPEPPRGGGGGSGIGSRAAPGTSSDEPPRLAIDSFHPGFGPTPSYLGRQDSAMDKVQMHGGAGTGAAADIVSPVSEGGGASASTGIGTFSSPSRSTKPAPGRYEEQNSEDEDEDRYNATPKKEGHVFRY